MSCRKSLRGDHLLGMMMARVVEMVGMMMAAGAVVEVVTVAALTKVEAEAAIGGEEGGKFLCASVFFRDTA